MSAPDLPIVASTICCTRCGTEFAPTAASLKKCMYLCAACRAARSKIDHARRKALGLKTSGRPSPEWEKAYRAEYYRRPDVRARRAELSRKVARDPAQRHKHEARRKARLAIARGDLVRQPCEVCGSQTVDAHHDDYSKPLQVRWLCRAHHAEFHARLRARGEEVGNG